MKKLTTIIAVLSIALVAGACSSKKSGTTTGDGATGGSKVVQINKEVAIGGLDYTVHSVEDGRKVEGFSAPSAGNKYVVVDLSVKNDTSEEFAFSIILFVKATNAAGDEFTHEITALLKPEAPDGKIAAGQTERGLVVFEVKDAPDTYTIHFRDPVGGTSQSVKLSA